MSSIIIHEREQDEEELERYSKKQKLDSDHVAEDIGILPPSHVLLGVPAPKVDIGKPTNFLETDVGISEYIGRGEAKVEGIIKQRSVYLRFIDNALLLKEKTGLRIFWCTKSTRTEM